MKKLITSLLLLMAGVMVVQARVWFDGTTLGSASKTFNSATNSIIKSGTVVWDGSSSTLTLNNVLIEVPEPS